MSAVQRIEHFHVIELRLVIPGLLGEPKKAPERLKVYEESSDEPEQEPVVKPVITETRSLVELYDDLLSARDAEQFRQRKLLRGFPIVSKCLQSRTPKKAKTLHSQNC